MPKYKISKSYLKEFFGLFGKSKKNRNKKISDIIDNDPVLQKLDKEVGDLNRAAEERLKKRNPELLKLINQYD